MEKTLRNKVLSGLAIVALGTGALQFGRTVIDQSRYERVRREVQIEADNMNDSNRVITYEEWTPVYQELGLENNGREGMDLSLEQLKQYLESIK